MTTIDEILATHRYTDRRGRIFRQTRSQTGFCEEWIQVWPKKENGYRHTFVAETQMRLLIERDQHREECAGIGYCVDHPVPSVLLGGIEAPWVVGLPHDAGDHSEHDTHAEAMDAARALAVGE